MSASSARSRSTMATASSDLVLAIGVEGDEVLRLRVLQRVLQPGLQGRTLAQIDRVPQHHRARTLGLVGRVVAGTVVDDDDVGEGRRASRTTSPMMASSL